MIDETEQHRRRIVNIRDGGSYDVAVVGGGPAGIMAATASARTGAKTLLVERNGYLGGELATGLPILVFYDQSGRLIMKGLPEDLPCQEVVVASTSNCKGVVVFPTMASHIDLVEMHQISR